MTYSKNFNLKYTVLRYGSVFGPSSQKWNGIYNYLNQAINNNKIICNGNGEEIREYIHVKDAAKLSVKVLERKIDEKAISIFGQKPVSVDQLFDLMFEILGKNSFLSKYWGMCFFMCFVVFQRYPNKLQLNVVRERSKLHKSHSRTKVGNTDLVGRS